MGIDSLAVWLIRLGVIIMDDSAKNMITSSNIFFWGGFY